MSWSEIPWRPTTATLRWFAVLAALVLGGLAMHQGLRAGHGSLAVVLATLALAVGGGGLVYPACLRFVFVGLLVLAYPVNWLVSHLLLALVFYCVFTPVAIWFKLIGRDALTRRFLPDADTYWTAKPYATDVRSYFRQG